MVLNAWWTVRKCDNCKQVNRWSIDFFLSYRFRTVTERRISDNVSVGKSGTFYTNSCYIVPPPPPLPPPLREVLSKESRSPFVIWLGVLLLFGPEVRYDFF